MDMDCQKCQELLSDALDDSLKSEDKRWLNAHLANCLSCAETQVELQFLTSFARRDYAATQIAPPDTEALWLRIKNQAEADLTWAREQREAVERSQAKQTIRQQKVFSSNLLSRLWNARWEVSGRQATAAFASVAIAVMLGAGASFNYLRSAQNAATQDSVGANASSANKTGLVSGSAAAARTTTVTAVNNYGRLAARNADDYVRQQQAESSYLMEMIENRKARFSPQVRESYERSLASLDQTVAESLEQLRRDPQDELSGEMLDAALREKAGLLKEFAEY